MILYRTKLFGILTDRVIRAGKELKNKRLESAENKLHNLHSLYHEGIHPEYNKLADRNNNFVKKLWEKQKDLRNQRDKGVISDEDFHKKYNLLENLSKNHSVDINKKLKNHLGKVDYLNKKYITPAEEKVNQLRNEWLKKRENFGKNNTNERTLDILLEKDRNSRDHHLQHHIEEIQNHERKRLQEKWDREDELKELEYLNNFLDRKQEQDRENDLWKKGADNWVSWRIFDSQKRKNENKILNHNKELNKKIKLESNQLRREMAKETREYDNPELFNSVLDSINNSIKMNPDDFSVKIDGKLKPLKITVRKGAKDAHYNPTTHEIITPPDPAVLIHELTHAGININTHTAQWGRRTNNPVPIKTSAGFVGGGRYNPHISKNSPESILNYKTSTLTEEELANKNAIMELYLRGASPADLDHAHKIGKFSNKSYRLHMGDNYSSGNQLL